MSARTVPAARNAGLTLPSADAIYAELKGVAVTRTSPENICDVLAIIKRLAAPEALPEAAPVAIPNGWKLVPLIPTESMIAAILVPDSPGYRFKRPGLEVQYRVMVEAAPASEPIARDVLTFVERIANGTIDPDKIAGQARVILEAGREGK